MDLCNSRSMQSMVYAKAAILAGQPSSVVECGLSYTKKSIHRATGRKNYIGWQPTPQRLPRFQQVLPLAYGVDANATPEDKDEQLTEKLSRDVRGDLGLDGENSSGFAPAITSQAVVIEEDDVVTGSHPFWDDFKVPFDYFTPIFIAGVLSVVLGLTQSVGSSPSLDAFTSKNMLEFQLPIQLAICMAVFLQAIAGWGFALAAIAGVSTLGPGVTVQEAQALVAMIAVPVDAGMFMPYLKGKKFDPSVVDRWVVGALIGTPLGVLSLKFVDQRLALVCLGSVLLAYCAYASYDIIRCYHNESPAAQSDSDTVGSVASSCKVTPSKYPAVGTWTTGVLAGLLGGVFDAPGPPLVVFADITGMANSPVQTRANFLAFFALSSQLVAVTDLLDGRFHMDFIWPSVIIAVPTMVIANTAGNWCAQFVDQDQFRWVVIGLLAACGMHQVGLF